MMSYKGKTSIQQHFENLEDLGMYTKKIVQNADGQSEEVEVLKSKGISSFNARLMAGLDREARRQHKKKTADFDYGRVRRKNGQYYWTTNEGRLIPISESGIGFWGNE